MAEAGYEVSLVAPVVVDGGEDDGVRVIPVPLYKNRLLRMTVGTLRAWRAALRLDADVYHLHSPELLPIGAIAAFMGRRVVFDAHEDLPDQIMAKPWIPPRVRPLVSVISRNTLRFAGRMLTGVVAATETIAADYPEQKTVVIRNFPADMPETVTLEPFMERPKRILYLGGLSESRGLTQLVNAMQIVGTRSGARLRLAGWFVPSSYQAALESLPGWKWVDYLGTLNREQMASELASSRLGVVTILPYPNHIRSEPNKLFEYMQAELPLLTSNFDYWKQFVSDRETGKMVDPSDSEQIAEGILWFLEHPIEAEAMGKRGRSLVETEFSWDSQAEKLDRYYRNRILMKP
jgi:glycosyltransferase involved in cell wall biosynthesis